VTCEPPQVGSVFTITMDHVGASKRRSRTTAVEHCDLQPAPQSVLNNDPPNEPRPAQDQNPHGLIVHQRHVTQFTATSVTFTSFTSYRSSATAQLLVD